MSIIIIINQPERCTIINQPELMMLITILVYDTTFMNCLVARYQPKLFNMIA